MISRKHKTIFVHIPKAAGQSVEHVFLQECGLDWDSRAPLLLRRNDDRSQGPTRLAHLYAREYVACGHVTQAEFDSYFKFAIVRNPYDRLLSEYRYRNPRRTPLWWFLLKPWRDDWKDPVRHRVPQVRFLHDGQGRLLVDRVIRFERLAEEMPEVFERALGQRRALPARNVSDKRPDLARKGLSRLHRWIIRWRYAEDFRVLGYDPGA
ncbi:hypothetical protein Ga0609869_003601 [Rhodovulum iodosum]|uniref:Sulfotransferase family protein n=1 Tax=Rhodovulum iodosum TaxID=68291 RepID=A0ABV3XY04_9RHOB|nr:sulfotransferase family 2 domain-containing protein [Rhodovulum robiginosum]RSK38897.1 hypothetical protein EJA01_01745 [Rhodovulum robiginosum]